MTIKEMERRTGLARSNIRFYEKEKLIEPSRNEQNGYRDYSEEDAENIRRIAFLRTLGISVEEIRDVVFKKSSLYDVLERQNHVLDERLTDLNRAKMICERMLCGEKLDFEELEIERYTEGLPDSWENSRQVFRMDSVSFIHLWGSFLTWMVITCLCLLVGIWSYAKLPPEIPVQWNAGEASSLVNKNFIFAYPAVCAAIRFFLRPCIGSKLQMYAFYGNRITEYVTNYLCFLALSVEIFSILFIFGIAENVVILLFVDTIVLLGLLCAGLIRLGRKKK